MEIIVLIVNYNSWDKTLAMLESADLLEIKPEIYVLDNNSHINPTTCMDTIAEEYSDVNIVQFPKNLGYFGAIHEFLRINTQLQFDWLFIANSDLIFSDPCLFNYLDEFSPEEQAVGIYCPSIISAVTERDQNPFLLKKPPPIYYYKYAVISSSFVVNKLYFYLFKLKAAFKKRMLRESSKEKIAMAIFAPHGAFLGLSKTFFKQGGFVENRNFLFHEEEIVGFICAAIGLKVIYDPRARICHEEHATTGAAMTHSKFLIKKKSLSIFKEYMFT